MADREIFEDLLPEEQGLVLLALDDSRITEDHRRLILYYGEAKDFFGNSLSCDAVGPHGLVCHRRAGHLKDDYPLDKHVSYDRQRYEEWPVGWLSLEKAAALLHETPPKPAEDSSLDYMQGWEDALRAVRELLTNRTVS